ncbi:CBN-BRE-3 protein [Caenorhabditis brenneri]|uniref:Beta-1,4-mannosyltransferase bre-3 n=1 Tax=Caenorhabditis brenneri TaxID=135651 RepID=G0MK35_CAEBE|nr:CBN-BRE-3 protein [Caenorhabditis brenneri]
MNCEVKHALHCAVLVAWIVCFAYFCGVFTEPAEGTVPESPVASYGLIWTVCLYLLRFTALLVLPQCLCNLCGLMMFNAFREKVQLKAAPLLSPFVCFRVVTKGNFPLLVKENIDANMKTCFEAGMENFIFEVVTDKAINLPPNPRVREVVVPTSYRTKSGAKFKARALQYCLEDDVNILQPTDWIVHLDEETLLTTNAICGILNFCEDGKHQFGQGVITYANGDIVNWLTTLSDSFRVADDMGKLRFQFKLFHKPLFGWKGSYVVTQVEAERDVSYDHGMEGSIAEDCFFSMVAMKHGYTFDFIEGEMHEKSPFTMWDFLQQRKRWLQGILLTVHSSKIAVVHKALLALSLYAWATMPLTSLQVFLCPLFPLPRCLPFDFLLSFVGALNLYMYIFGVVKSFSHKYRNSFLRLGMYLAGALMTIPFNILIENAAVLVGMFGRKDQFYIVNKDIQTV